MRAQALAEAIAADRAAGHTHCWSCSTHGTTASMAFDPAAAIGEDLPREGDLVARRRGDGRHRRPRRRRVRWVNAGLDLVDRYGTDPQKWVGVGFDCDLYWIADRAALLGALRILPEYLRSAAAEAGTAIDYRDWGIPLGRRFRSLKLWFRSARRHRRRCRR